MTIEVPESHQQCCVCSSAPDGNGLCFVRHPDGGVRALVPCTLQDQGYDGIIHGGRLAAWLDAAMTNCLFAKGIEALTADLEIRYLKPVALDQTVEVYAWVEEACTVLYRLRAEVRVSGIVHARAKARFVRRPAQKTRQEGM